MVRVQGRPFDLLVPRGALRGLGLSGTAGVKRPRTGRRRKLDDAYILANYKLDYLDVYHFNGVRPSMQAFADTWDISADTLTRYLNRLHLLYPPA
jgi:hypothetical protein